MNIRRGMLLFLRVGILRCFYQGVGFNTKGAKKHKFFGNGYLGIGCGERERPPFWDRRSLDDICSLCRIPVNRNYSCPIVNRILFIVIVLLRKVRYVIMETTNPPTNRANTT